MPVGATALEVIAESIFKKGEKKRRSSLVVHSPQALKSLVDRNKVLLIDVRNRTELNEKGQIPGSVCLPLHEVDAAFDGGRVSDQEFLERYGFPRPGPRREDVVLTCRSGRRVWAADRLLRRRGYERLRIYSGSFRDWVRRGGETFLADYDLDYDILN